MAVTANSLSDELECAICSDQLEHPKFIGPCNHTFCKHCIDQLWVSLGRRRIVPCPQCREECPIPSSGVGGLKDNFMAANIIGTYRNQQQRAAHLAEIKCTLCPNRASCFCKDCDLKLCPDCKRQHDRDPNKHDHDIFGLCPSHGNGLWLFCKPCKQAVCGGCRVSDHDQGDHYVTPIRQVFDNLVSRIQESSAELEDAVMTRDKEQKKKLSQLRDNVQQKSTSAENQATAGTERTIAQKRKDIQDHKAKSQETQEQIDLLQKQIDHLMKEKKKGDERTKQLVKDVDKLEKEKAKIIADVREKFAKSSEEINLRLRSLETRRNEVTLKLEQGQVVGYTKITIDTESIAYLTSLSQELVDLINASRERDTRTVIEEATRSISELGLDIGDMGQGQAVMSGDHQIRIGNAKRVFRQLKKVCNVTFPRDRPCEIVYRLKHLHGPESRLVTLGRYRGNGADTIYFHDEVSSSLTGTITEGVNPARDIAFLSTGEVVVARQEKPPLRVFNPATGAYRDINIIHDGEVIDTLWRVETDESDNMFVLPQYHDPFLLVLKPNGNVIQRVKLRGYVYDTPFCSLNRILYISADDRIRRFHWSNNILNEMSSSSHGVAGFRCNDVSIGNEGEVLVAGYVIGNVEIVVYQVAEGEDEEELVWRKIEYQDGVKRASLNSPHICINDNNLWLGYGNKIEKFQLV